MSGATSKVKGVLAYFPTPMFLKIDGEPTIKGLIDLHRLISGNAASVASNLGGDRHGHLALTMTATEYRAHTGLVFLPPHNPGNYPQSMGNSQEQALGTEKFQQNQALFRKYTAMDGALKSSLSRRWTQSSCPHLWINLQGLDRCPHSPKSNTCYPVTSKSTKSTLKRTR